MRTSRLVLGTLLAASLALLPTVASAKTHHKKHAPAHHSAHGQHHGATHHVKAGPVAAPAPASAPLVATPGLRAAPTRPSAVGAPALTVK